MDEAKSVKHQTLLSETLPVGSKSRTRMKAHFSPRLTHGGIPSLQKRKTTRPFAPNVPVQLVLQSNRAKGVWSLAHRKHQAKIRSMIYVYAKRFKVKVFQAKTTGHQIHLLVKAQEKKHLSDFLRVLAGRVAVVVSGARKHVKRIGRFWDYLCWSRLVNWGKEFFQVRAFINHGDLVRSVSLETLNSEAPDFTVEWEQAQPGK